MTTQRVPMPMAMPGPARAWGLPAALAGSWAVAVRQIRNLYRQPAWIVIGLSQPVVWLLLYGALLRKIVEIPGFGGGSYVTFLTPGIVVMNAFFVSGWSGMDVIDDVGRGVFDRFLITPIPRGALITGRLIHGALSTVVQSGILVVLGLALGARFPGGVPGLLALAGCAVLLGIGVGGLSSALALVLRKSQSVIAAGNFLLLPLTFLSSIFIRENLAPGWIQELAHLNPVNWTVEAGRAALASRADWSQIGERAGGLLVFAVVCCLLAVRALRSYQRSA
jgi:ABC-2 type transport system permease protein